MQPYYALLLVTSYPKTVGGMCYAIIQVTLIGLKQPLVTSQSQAGKLDMLSKHASVDKLSQHSPNHRPVKLDILSQHAVTTNHKSGKSDCQSSMHSADKLSKHALQNMHCIKEAAKAQSSGHADTAK